MATKNCYLIVKQKNLSENTAKFKLVPEPMLNDTYHTKGLDNYPDVYVKFNETIELPIINSSSTKTFYKLYDETLQNEKYFSDIVFPTSNDPTARYSGNLYMSADTLTTNVFNNLHYYKGGVNTHRLVECEVVINGNPNAQNTYFSLNDVCTFNKIYVDLDSLTCKRRISHKDDANPSHTYNGVYYQPAYNCYDENFNLLDYDNDAPVLVYVLGNYVINDNSLLNTNLRLFREGSTNGASNGNANLNKTGSKDILRIKTNDIIYVNINDEDMLVRYMYEPPYKIVEEGGVTYAECERSASSYGTVQFFVKQSEISTGDGIIRKCKLIYKNEKKSLILTK